MTGPEPRRVVLDAADVRFSALVAGDPDRPWILLLHGIPASAELWRDVLPLLAAGGLHAVAPDLAGYGTTTFRDPQAVTLGGNADALARWLAAVHPDPVWWVGHDLGGAVTQLSLVRHPGRISRITLSNAPRSTSWPVPAVRQLRQLARLGLYPTLAAAGLATSRPSTRALAHSFGDRSALTPDLLARVFWDTKVTSPAGRRAFGRFVARLDEHSFAAETAQLSAGGRPVQLVWGSADPYQRWDPVGRGLAELLGATDVRVLDGVGHFVPVEAPDRMAAALLAFT